LHKFPSRSNRDNNSADQGIYYTVGERAGKFRAISEPLKNALGVRLGRAGLPGRPPARKLVTKTQ
jgi:hypothetical protein